jgi:hypothetical protein
MPPAAINADADTHRRIGVWGVAITIAGIAVIPIGWSRISVRRCVPVRIGIIAVGIAITVPVIRVPEADAPSAIAIATAEAVAAVATITTTETAAIATKAAAETTASTAYRSRTTTPAAMTAAVLSETQRSKYQE